MRVAIIVNDKHADLVRIISQICEDADNVIVQIVKDVDVVYMLDEKVVVKRP